MKLPYSRALVTGATGFIGAHVCQVLQKAGVTVHTVSLDGALPAGLQGKKNIVTHTADVTDAVAVKHAVKNAKPQVVFHLAAYGTPLNERDVQQMIAVNVGGTQNLLLACLEYGAPHFIQTGSVKEYATSRTPITEEVPLRPWDDYAATKAAGGFFCRLAAERHGLPVTVLRFSPAYGPGEAEVRFVPTAIRAALEGTPFTISVSSLVRNFTYIDDVVSAFIAASLQSAEGYEEFNIGSEQPYSFDDILKEVEAATGRTIARVVSAPQSSHDDSWVIDSSKAKRVLGWKPRVSFSTGIKRTVKWYKTLI